ncbi:MAG: prolipoprotein diacylglyceryl transferase [Desulfuromonadales bacterium]|nr:prolipoprotein diacylglyceryl transferase [Desulfuromonadales bacterium]
MLEVLFVLGLGLGSLLYLAWGVRSLPVERWQFLAALPTARDPRDEHWCGINLTWYGFLSANAYLLAIMLFLVLTAAAGVPLEATLLFCGGLLALCVPASRLVARLIEKKAHTFTVGGAVFIGLLAAPWLMGLLRSWLGHEFAGLPVLAALAIAYALGEGLGRLACLSFGCCYGRPLDDCPPLLQRLFARRAVRFFGTTKKIAYAGGLEGVPVLPVQALTALLYTATSLCSTALFLGGQFLAAFCLCLIVTQLWRVGSEWLRADFRGHGRALTAYQWMGLTALPYSLLALLLLPAGLPVEPRLAVGLQALWQPGLLLTLQALWLLLFLFTGRSEVTGARLSFHVHAERI